MIVAYEAIIQGRVQGVYYRKSTQKMANQLQVTGWVKNLPNGAVACYLCGPAQPVQQMIDWLWQGPPAAQVTDVTVTATKPQSLTAFEIR